MSDNISIDFPSDLLQAAHMSSQDVKRELAVALYEQGRLSFGKSRELASMTVADFQTLLGSRGVCVHYDVDEYRQDREVLRREGVREGR